MGWLIHLNADLCCLTLMWLVCVVSDFSRSSSWFSLSNRLKETLEVAHASVIGSRRLLSAKTETSIQDVLKHLKDIPITIYPKNNDKTSSFILHSEKQDWIQAYSIGIHYNRSVLSIADFPPKEPRSLETKLWASKDWNLVDQVNDACECRKITLKIKRI